MNNNPTDYGLNADQLDQKYNRHGGGEHPSYPRADWRQEVAAENSLTGYWEWVVYMLDIEEVETTVGCIYAPIPGTEAASIISAGSAVVGFTSSTEDFVDTYFEGNLHNAKNLHVFHERIKCAAGRMFQRYPTIAKRRFPLTDLVKIGVIDKDYHIAILNQKEAARIEEDYAQRNKLSPATPACAPAITQMRELISFEFEPMVRSGSLTKTGQPYPRRGMRHG